MIMETKFIITNTDTQAYTRRMETFEGKEYWVLPVTMMVEGVRNGSMGPILHTREELSKYVESWNGRPVVIHHPQQDGMNVSAADPEVLQEYGVGTVFHARFENDRLKAEAWVDPDKLREVNMEAYNYIESGRPMEVSLGMFSDQEFIAGEYEGIQYNAIAHNYKPDHLALLPDEIGACSWEHGCGIRTNQLNINEGGANVNTKEKKPQDLSQININVTGDYKKLVTRAREKIDSLDGPLSTNFLRAIYDDYLVFETQYREPSNDRELFRQSYTVDNEMRITLSGAPQRVTENVEYVVANSDSQEKSKTVTPIRTKFKSKEEITMNGTNCESCRKKVDALIANSATAFTEDNREWLMDQEEGVLDVLAPKAPPQTHSEKPIELTANDQRVLAIMNNKSAKLEEVLSILPEAVKTTVENGIKMYNDHKKQIVDNIMANSADAGWTEEKLNSMDLDVLESLSKTVSTNADYSAVRPGGFQANTKGGGDDEVLLPTGFGVATAEKK